MTVASRPASDTQGIDGTAVLALTYLAVPNLIFIFGWFRLPIAIVLGFVLSYLFFKVVRAGSISWHTGFTPAAALLVFGTAFTWAAFGGGSHFMHAPHDWAIRDAVLGDLVYGAWPPAYPSADGGSYLLRSALGYFLVPAVFGKLFGTTILTTIVFLWTVIGVSLFFFLLPLPQRSFGRLIASLVVVVFFSGADVLGYLVSTGEFPAFPGRIEWWVPYSYSSLSGQLLWAPNHALPIWLATALVYRYRNSIHLTRLLLTLLPLTLIWTPFAILGILPFVALAMVRHAASLPSVNCVGVLVIAAVVFSLPIAHFLTIDITGISRGPQGYAAPSNAAGLSVDQLLNYLAFVVFEVGLIALALLLNLRSSRTFLLVAVAVLVLLPLFSYGPSNDAALRLSAPALVVLAILCIEVVAAVPFSGSGSRPILLLGLVLVIGANTALNELARSALFRHWQPDYTVSLGDRQGGTPAPHYAGRLDNPMTEALLKDRQPVPTSASRR